MVYRIGLRAQRQFMNELKSRAFITERYFTSELKTQEAETALWFPCCSAVKSSRRMNSSHCGVWSVRNFGCPCALETMHKPHQLHQLYEDVALWLRKCQSRRQAAMSSRPSASDLVRSDSLWPPSIGSPSVGKRSCRRRENLPRLLSRPNKAAIISPTCSVWVIMPTLWLLTESCVRRPLLQSRVPSQVTRQRCWVISVYVCMCVCDIHVYRCTDQSQY